MKSEALKEFHEFQKIFPSDRFLLDSQSLEHWGRDWTKQFPPNPCAIVFPKTVEEVQAIVRLCRKHKLPIVPSGGRTGLSAGAVATMGELVVSFDKMNQVLEKSPLDQTITVQPGVITQNFQQIALELGMYFPVDFASRGSSQIGGNLSTNAGGVKVLKYGMIRDWVTSIKVVAGTGEIFHFNKGLVKNASGYDFRHLFVGSEGTLGLIVEATLRLTRPPGDLQVLFLGVKDLQSIMAVYKRFRSGLDLFGFEYVSHPSLQQVVDYANLKAPLPKNFEHYLIIEFDSTADSERAADLFEQALKAGECEDGIVSSSPEQAKALWRFREDVSEASQPYFPYKNDVSVRISSVPEFLVKADAILKREYPTFKVLWFGHVGDGNMHINILKPEEMDSADFLKHCSHVDELLFSVIQEFGGSISAEHGVGLLKKPYLQFTRDRLEVEAMKSVKRIFDPDQILNPGKIFD